MLPIKQSSVRITLNRHHPFGRLLSGNYPRMDGTTLRSTTTERSVGLSHDSSSLLTGLPSMSRRHHSRTALATRSVAKLDKLCRIITVKSCGNLKRTALIWKASRSTSPRFRSESSQTTHDNLRRITHHQGKFGFIVLH